MPKLIAVLLLTSLASPSIAQDLDISSHRADADALIAAALSDSAAWERLAELTDTFGPRLSGTDNLEHALDWILEGMQADGLENVHAEPVMVPRWERGRESATLIEPRYQPMLMLGLGGSIATPPEGITAEVLVVGSFDELTSRAAEAEGKIVLFNVPFTTYGQTVQYRSRGAIEAARVGGVASLIATVGSESMYTPHTGAMGYDDQVPRIPHAALTIEDARMLHRMQARGQRIVVRLQMEARWLPDRESRNVIAEIVGSEFPEQIVVLGGHSDSWDVGTGAMDDAGGCVAAWEALRLMKTLGLRPKRTVRVALWVNEENGLRGGNAYRDAHAEELADHVLAMESDAGVFKPIGFGFTGSDAAFEVLQSVATLLDPLGSGLVTRGGGGADIGPIMREGVPGMGLNVDGTRYFHYHHSHADTVDKLDPHDVALSVATMAVMAYTVANLQERLAR